MSGDVRRLRRWSRGAVRTVAAALDAEVAAWARAWNVSPGAVACDAADAVDAEGIVWWPLDAASGPAWLGTRGDRRVALRRLLEPADRSSAPATLAAAMADAAWTDLAARLASRIPPAAAQGSPDLPAAAPATARRDPPAADRSHWSGALVARWSAADGGCIALHLAEPAVRGWVGGDAEAHRRTAPATVDARAAVERQRATLRAVLAPTALPLGALLGLAPGDVVPLDHPLDRPLVLELALADGPRTAGRPLAHAHLGARDGHRALSLVRPSEEPA